MRSSKAFLLLGLVAAIVLLISSEIAARELAETSSENGVNDVKPDQWGPRYGYLQPRCFYGCCDEGSYGGGCEQCCDSVTEAAEKAAQVKPQN